MTNAEAVQEATEAAARLKRAQERGAIIAAAKRKKEAARLAAIADRDGVIG